MLLELCNRVKTFLHSHNHPPTQSFFDEMMTNKKKQEDIESAQLEAEITKQKEWTDKQV